MLPAEIMYKNMSSSDACGKIPDDEPGARLSSLRHRHKYAGSSSLKLPEDNMKRDLQPLNVNVSNELLP